MRDSLGDADSFKKLIRHWRRSRGITQEKLSEIVGVSQHQLSFIENGHSRPSLATTERIVAALSIPPRDGNHLLGLLGYSGTLQEPESTTTDVQLSQSLVSGLLIKGIDPYPAAIVNSSHHFVHMNLSMARLLDRVAHVADVFEDGQLSYPRVVFHEEGFQASFENWEEFAASYAQSIIREAMLNPKLNPKTVADVLDTPEVPEKWKELSDEFGPSVDIILRVETPFGSLQANYVTLGVAPPQAHIARRIEPFFLGMLVPVNESSHQIFEKVWKHGGSVGSHPRLAPFVV